MRPRALVLHLLLLAACRATSDHTASTSTSNSASNASNDTTSVFLINNTALKLEDVADGNYTIEGDDEHEPIVRKKRTFGDLVFRGLADVLGYNVARKPPQAAIPPPLAPVPGIDIPLQAGPAAAPAPPPCGAPRAAAPPPCQAKRPPPPPPPPPPPRPRPPPPPPCPRPRANPRPKPPPPPPPPPPCAKPRAANTPPPCAPPPPPPPPPPKKQGDNLDSITSNFRLNFDFNRIPATPAPLQAEEEQQYDEPIAIQPHAAQLPLEQPRKPRVYVDAFVVRNGVAQKLDAVDADSLNNGDNDESDYLAYDDVNEEPQQLEYDDYEGVQESRDRAKAVKEFGTAVDRFWDQKTKNNKKKKTLPDNHYRKVHFGDRDLVRDIQRRSDEGSHQGIQKKRPRKNRNEELKYDAEAETEDNEKESTTTTEDPKKSLRPKVLPPTEQNPNNIDTVTVRVPPIYKEKRPKKYHRNRPEQPDRDESEENTESAEEDSTYNEDTEGENSAPPPRTEPPARQTRRKQRRRTRSTQEDDNSDETYEDPYSAGDYDYYGKKLPVSEEEKFYRELVVPEPTIDSDVARVEHESKESGYFLDDHERLQNDPEREKEEEDENEESLKEEESRIEDNERADDKERDVEDKEREKGDVGRADERERTDKLSPNARIRETGYSNKFIRAHNIEVDDPRPHITAGKRNTIG